MNTERQRFEDWYTVSAFDLKASPIGSRDCALQWAAWCAALVCRQPTPEAADEKLPHYIELRGILRDEPAHPPKPTEARELNLKWGRHDGRGEYHIEWHAPCGCAYHHEPKPHVHSCIKHAEIDQCQD